MDRLVNWERLFVVLCAAMISLGWGGTRAETPAPKPAPAVPPLAGLIAAAKAGALDAAVKAIADGADVNGAGNDGLRPLHVAAFRGRANIAALLLDHGAKVNQRDDFGMTPLHAAAFEGRKDVAEILLKRGADPSAKDSSGYTPFQYAKSNGKEDLAALLQSPDPRPPKKETRKYTDEDIGGSFSTDGEAYLPSAHPPPSRQADYTSSQPDLPDQHHYNEPLCRQRIRALQERRQQVFDRRSNWDVVDRERIQREIDAEEKFYHSSCPANNYNYDWQERRHEEKILGLQRQLDKEKKLSPRAEAEIRSIDEEIKNIYNNCK